MSPRRSTGTQTLKDVYRLDCMSNINQAKTASTSTFVTALVFNVAVFAAELVAFTILRPYFKRIYEARTFNPIPSKRTPALTGSIFAWPIAVFRADYTDIQRVNGMDAYFFVRFLRMIVRILFPIWLVSWVILLPITSVGTHVDNHSGLDNFIFGNVAPNVQSRLWAHLVLAFLFTGWIWYNIKIEMRHFVTARQLHLVSPEHSSSAQANTMLITGVPQKYLSEKALTDLFSHLPGGVRKVWLNRDLKELPDAYDDRLKACNKLESAETSLLNTATKLRNKKLKADVKAAKKSSGKETDSGAVDRRPSDGRPLTEPSLHTVDADVDAERDITLAEKLVPEKKRPTHRLPVGPLPFSLPLIGKKVDSIEWAREEIERTNLELEKGRRSLHQDISLTSGGDMGGEQTYPPLNSAFILFNKQIAVHLAKEALIHHEPYRMATKYVEVAPDDVIWGNLGLNPYEKSVREAVSWALTIGLIILWAFPVAFVGIVSNIRSVCQQAHWLAWICALPSVIVGIISGILPTVLLAVLMMLLPIVLRLLARFQGIPTYSGLELSLMSRYFMFQVIHSFLIVTISSGITAALPGLINNPASIPTLLAQNLPSASNFFLTYVLLQGLSGSAAGFLQAVPLVLYYVKLYILGSTPRSVYNIKYVGRSVAWGTLFPGTTLLVVVAFGYMIISPIINGLACASFFLFYLVYKYLFLWVFDQPRSRDTGGLFFPKAIQHVFVGLYIQQVCLCALFFLARDGSNKASAVPEGALMIVLIVFTVFFHYTINRSYGPLIEALPLTLVDKTFGMPEPEPVDDAQVRKSSGTAVREKRGSVSSSRKGKAGAEQEQRDNASQYDAHEAELQRRPSEEDSGPREFEHPATVEAQRTIWLPRDELGLAEAEVAANRERGIDVSLEGAVMDGKGHVDVNAPPPEEARLLAV
ncbi:DUF221-domain-containing protein [Gloeophyllum trabeum ATCC 11539]|uniref:DUF221-domain-containing protein n=1 Tax=Gloeophyllum trabeum (strain ATCC 11539 / FP-39264 / Madison 617) TaxID=670483 RepID=S7PXH4_GLOTA|nr:DUF221-domain-containing protein [Gloeophyllum trabeum ATCC 11539]EPQ52218.1 DUF221-domain-containing protein [Gloeophyllum trabeum ATCC 11539]